MDVAHDGGIREPVYRPPIDASKLRESFDRINNEARRRSEDSAQRMREYLGSLNFETYLISYIPGRGVVTRPANGEHTIDVLR